MLNWYAVVLLFCCSVIDLRTHMHKHTHQSARKFSWPQHSVSCTHINLHSPFTCYIHAKRDREQQWRDWICFTRAMVRLNKDTRTHSGKHTCTDLMAAAWVILSLEVGSGCLGEGSLCRVGVYVFILFTLCFLNRDNKIPGLYMHMLMPVPNKHRHTHVHMHWRCWLTFACCCRGHHWCIGVSL